MVDRTTGDEGGLRDIPPDPQQGSNGLPPYRLLTIEEMYDLPTPPAIVRGLMRQGELTVFYGDPGCYKTFVAVDLGLRIAAGLSWWGRRTMQGAVLYLAGEGAGGLKRRVMAWGIENELDPRDLHVRVLPHSIALMAQAQFDPLLAAIAALDTKPIVIFVDTLARYMIGGDENSALDMGLFVGRCSELSAAAGASIVVVHHKRKGHGAERGSSALRGAADVMVEVKRHGHCVELVGEKSKDDAPLRAMYLETRSVGLGFDEEGEAVSSLVLVEGKAPEVTVENLVPPPADATPVLDSGARIRQALAVVFAHRPTSGDKLLPASGLKRTPFYDALKTEIIAGRVKASDPGKRTPRYELTSTAPEYRDASPSPSPSPDVSADSDSIEVSGASPRVRVHHPLKGVDADSNSDSPRSDTSSQQKKINGSGRGRSGQAGAASA